MKLNTKIKAYRATVLTTLLYGAETWTCHRRHVKMLDAFHMRHLRYLMGIKWQDKITNNEVLQGPKMDGIYYLGDANEGTVEMGRSRATNE